MRELSCSFRALARGRVSGLIRPTVAEGRGDELMILGCGIQQLVRFIPRFCYCSWFQFTAPDGTFFSSNFVTNEWLDFALSALGSFVETVQSLI